MILMRTKYSAEGVFGELSGDTGEFVCYTLEHAYPQPDGSYAPKLNSGDHTCVRGQHRLHNMTEDFTTFEITEVPGHSNILFHWGNYNSDSEGCVLLGTGLAPNMLTESREAFKRFMDNLDGVDTFTLTVQA